VFGRGRTDPARTVRRTVTGPGSARATHHVSLFVDGGAPPRGVESLPTLGQEREADGGGLAYEVWPPTRGVHLLGPFTTRRRDPLRLVTWRVRLGESTEFWIGPADDDVPLPATAEETLGRAAGGGDPTPDSLTRPYRDGDPVRRIHWPVSARQGRLMMRPDTRDEDGAAAVFLDRAAEHYAGPPVHIPGPHGGFASSVSFEAALASAAALTAPVGADAPRLVPFPPVAGAPRERLLPTLTPADGTGRPGGGPAGGVIVTGMPGRTAAAWPSTLPSRHVTVLLHGGRGARPAPEALAAWARAGWSWHRVGEDA